MKNPSAVAAAFVLVTLALPGAIAAGPFEILRAGSPSAVAAAAPIAAVSASPVDDLDVGGAGLDRYYVVRDGAGARLTIAVLRLPAGGVRISFDDGNPASAPADPLASIVTVNPPSVPADGLTAALVTIAPRDASGLPIGRGLALSIDAGALWPGRLDGPVLDRGDGSYEARVVSTVPGTGLVRVAVEGTILATAPTVVFEDLLSGRSPRDLARLMIEDLTAPGGRFDALVAAAPNGSAASAVLSARSLAQDVAAQLRSSDLLLDGSSLKTSLRVAIESLLAAKAGASPEFAAAIDALVASLLDAARLLAEYHLALARTQCGLCDPVRNRPKKVCEIEVFLASAESARAASDPAMAAHWYGVAIDRAQIAFVRCN